MYEIERYRTIAIMADSDEGPDEYANLNYSTARFIAVYHHDTAKDAAKSRKPAAPEEDYVDFHPVIQSPDTTDLDIAKQVVETGETILLATGMEKDALEYLESNGVRVFRSVAMSLFDNYRAWADSTLFDLWEWQCKEPNPFRIIQR